MEWIKCSDRMPEYSKAVLITDGKFVHLGWVRNPAHFKGKHCPFDSHMGVKPNTTHWMPLPEPPKI